MSVMAPSVTSLTIVYITVYSGAVSNKTWKLRVTGLCEGNSPVTQTGEFSAQMFSDAENVSIWWRHHAMHLHGSRIGLYREPVFVQNGANISHNNGKVLHRISFTALKQDRFLSKGSYTQVALSIYKKWSLHKEDS